MTHPVPFLLLFLLLTTPEIKITIGMVAMVIVAIAMVAILVLTKPELL